MKKRGVFITFEGCEGCGKTTQISMLSERLQKANQEILVTREPGGTSVGEKIRHILIGSDEETSICPETELLLFAASRAQLVREVIVPELDLGKFILCDRFLDSTTVYQGVARQLADGPVKAINQFAVGNLMPDLTIVIDIPAEESLLRVQRRKNSIPDRIEKESIEKVEEKQPIIEQEKTENKIEESSKKEPKTKSGRWVIEKKGEGEYISTLLASNGELMLTSETYASEEGARNGVSTIINAVDSGKFIVYQDKNKNYYCKLKTASNRLLCVSEIYDNEGRCLMAIESIKRFAKESPIQEQVNIGVKYVDYTPVPLNLADVKKGTEGKWKIEKEGNKYWAKLYASNGQVMLATEQVVNVKNARNAIDSVKKNALEGNFIIDHDKSGRFYYKLRNSQRSVICVGEAYDKLESCLKAIESVRRFATTAVIVEE